MDTKKFNIVLDAKCKELVIREGAAIPAREPKCVKIDETIDAPLLYLKNRINWLVKEELMDNCHLTVNKESGQIDLYIGENSPYMDTISGTLVLSKPVNEFDLESEKYRTPEDTANFLRKRKHLFRSEAEYANVFAALRTFTAKVNQEIAQIKDDSGNFEQKRKQVVEHNIPKGFTLKLPIFKGVDPIEVEVEFLVNKSLDVAMFSTDLIQKDQLRGEILDGVVKGIQETAPDLLIMYV